MRYTVALDEAMATFAEIIMGGGGVPAPLPPAPPPSPRPVQRRVRKSPVKPQEPEHGKGSEDVAAS